MKRWLIGALVIGVLAFSGTGGTFASFNAQTTNGGSSIASGTLTMSNSVNSATACLSSTGTGANGNSNANCSQLFSLPNVEPGSWSTSGASAQTATVAVKNTGTLNASSLWLEAPSTTDCADAVTSSGSSLNFNSVAVSVGSATLTSGSTSVTTSVTNGFSKVSAGMTVTATGIPASTTVSSVTNSTTIVLNKAATQSVGSETLSFGASASSVTLTAGSTTATSSSAFPSYLTGLLVTGTISGSSAIPTGTIVTSVAGSTLTLSQAASASGSATLTFGGNAFCQSLLMYVQEAATVGSTTDYYCWYGYGDTSGATTGASEATTSGFCPAPVNTTLASAISCSPTCPTVTSLSLASLTGPVYVGDTIVVTNDQNFNQSFTVAAPSGQGSSYVYPPSSSATTVSVTSTTAQYSFGTDSTVADQTTNGHLNGDTTDTVANFDSLHAAGLGPLVLYPISGPGTVSTTVPQSELATGATRTFTVGVYLPNPVNNQNDLQGLQSTFGLTWYMSQ